jgi:hypothetical protein
MLTIWGIFLLAAGIFIAALGPRLLPKLGSGPASVYLGTALVLLGAGLQVYEAWWRLPPHCRSVLSLSCEPLPPAAKSKRR